jgi:hypothetical protein
MEIKKALTLEKGIQTKDSRMKMLDPADLFVQMRVIEWKIKEVI